MKFIKISALLFFGFLIPFSSCTNSDENSSEIITMKVKHFKQSGNSLFPYQFLLVQEGDDISDDIYNMIYNSIEDFNYELGYFYTLKTEKQKIENPPMDGSSIRYKLIKEISKEKAPSDIQFHILLSRLYDDHGFEPFYEKTDMSTFQLLDGTKINCGSLCDELAEKLAAKEAITGTFKHSNSNELYLIDLN